MSGFIIVPIVRVRNVGFLAIVRNVVCTNCRGATLVNFLLNLLARSCKIMHALDALDKTLAKILIKGFTEMHYPCQEFLMFLH